MSIADESLRFHKEHCGKIEIKSKVKVDCAEDLALAYTPGVAQPCLEIAKEPQTVYDYTNIGNTVAVVTDGSAVLGLGNIGGQAGLPVMEGKCVLFKEFGGIDAFPIILDTHDIDAIVETVKHIAPGFGGINLEDIKAPECFEIEERLKRELPIPIFHDDQHGTAIVVLAGIINALKLIEKDMTNVTATIAGAGAAGIAIGKLLLSAGIHDVILCNSRGILDPADDTLDDVRRDIAKNSNRQDKKGTLADALVGADIFIGVSGPNIVTVDMVRSMNERAIAFAMANPIPEILPEIATEGGIEVMGTGRSDYPNQINNVLAFPGIFKGAMAVRARDINEEMKIAAAYAIAGLVDESELSADYIIPTAFDKRVGDAVAQAVAKAARKTGVNRI